MAEIDTSFLDSLSEEELIAIRDYINELEFPGIKYKEPPQNKSFICLQDE